VRDLTPHHYAAHLQLGRLFARQKRFDEAHYLLGVELASDGRVSEAGAAFTEVLRLRPERVLARLNLGNVLARQNRFAEARLQFEDVLRRDPQNAAARQAIADLPQPPPSATPL
jgi:cytochrome c-type biogenesis protein CcmH/NrfG